MIQCGRLGVGRSNTSCWCSCSVPIVAKIAVIGSGASLETQGAIVKQKGHMDDASSNSGSASTLVFPTRQRLGYFGGVAFETADEVFGSLST